MPEPGNEPPFLSLPESEEVRTEHFWRKGGGFHWCWPHFDVVQSVDRGPRVLLNRYPHNVIGVMVILFGRGYGVRWKDSRPRRRRARSSGGLHEHSE